MKGYVSCRVVWKRQEPIEVLGIGDLNVGYRLVAISFDEAICPVIGAGCMVNGDKCVGTTMHDQRRFAAQPRAQLDFRNPLL